VLRFKSKFPDAQRCFYEVIRNKHADPVHMIFDLERDFSPLEAASLESRMAARQDTWDALLRRTQELLSNLCGEPVTLTPGANCQVLESLYPHKFSRHLLVYAQGMTSVATARVAAALHASSMALPPGHPERHLLAYRSAKGVPRSVFDTSVYSMNKAMRMAYCCKREKHAPMMPTLGSSLDGAAHLVNVTPPELFTPPQRLPPLDLDKLPDAAKAAKDRERSSCIGRAGTARDDGNDDGDLAEGAQPTPSWQPGQLDALRADLIANEDIRAKLGVRQLCLADRGKVADDGRAYFFYVKREGGRGKGDCCHGGMRLLPAFPPQYP
jgi:hypothetical protein